MYLVDTTILSDARRRVYISAISLGEMQKGFELKVRRDPVGAQPCLSWLTSLQKLHGDRILGIADVIALEWGRIEARRPMSWDGLIAATAVVHQLTLVTRNVADFRDLPITVLDPWDAVQP